MTTFVYLHGFNSAFAPENDKVESLSILGEVVGISYDSYSSYQKIYDHLATAISQYDLDDTVVVGTSLGGFWAAVMGSKLSIPSIIINPCYDPTNMLQKHVGPQKNYATGMETNFELDSALSYNNYKLYDLQYRYLPLVLLDMSDDVIDSFESKELFKGFPNAQYDGGSHRFDHMEESLPNINIYLNRCSFIDHMC